MTKYNIIDDSKTIKVKIDARGDNLVRYNVPKPRDAIKYIPVPYVPNGFENSCSECSAEMILRYWKVDGWSQYEIHEKGYQTFEGGISVGDLGLLNMFEYEQFHDTEGKAINLHVSQMNDAKIEDVYKYLDADIPVIIRFLTNSWGDRHTVVLIGYSKDAFYYHCNDQGENRRFALTDFKKQWLKTLIAVYPEGRKI